MSSIFSSKVHLSTPMFFNVEEEGMTYGVYQDWVQSIVEFVFGEDIWFETLNDINAEYELFIYFELHWVFIAAAGFL